MCALVRGKVGWTGSNRLGGDTFTTWLHSPYSGPYATDTHTHRWTETNREKGERLTELLPLLYLWRLSQQANCITNRLIIQREKRRCWGRERRRDGHKKEGWSRCQLAIKREKLDFFCNKNSSCQKFPMWQMFSRTSTLLAPFVLSEKRRRFAGWSLRAERCSSSTRFRRDPWLCWTSSRCEVPSIYLSTVLFSRPALAACQRCWPGSAASVEIHQKLDEHRMLLSGNSDPAVLDRCRSTSPTLGDCWLGWREKAE